MDHEITCDLCGHAAYSGAHLVKHLVDSHGYATSDAIEHMRDIRQGINNKLMRVMNAAPALLALCEELATDLENEIRARYDGGLLNYPHNRAKLARELELVDRARAAIAQAKGEL